jgi:outer membrane protein
MLASVGSALALVPAATTSAAAESLNEALVSAYEYNPRLDAERARLRATDESIAIARSGFRPKIDFSADTNVVDTKTRPPGLNDGTFHPKGYRFDGIQPIFSGLRVINAVNEAEAVALAGAHDLRGVEQEVLLEAVVAYMDVIRDQAIVQLREDNVNVLSKDLKATQERFAVGEVTKTDVAQAQARRALAVSDLDQARANLKTARGNFERTIGHPPSRLFEPEGYAKLLPATLEESIAISAQEHPSVVSALYTEQAARFGVDKIRGELLPTVTLEGSYEDRYDTSRFINRQEQATVTGRLTMPIYEGGEVYARVRQAKHIHIGRLQDIEQARTQVQAEVVAAWSQMQASRARLESEGVQVSANTTALAGVREEERVGQRSLLDVLDAELELLSSQVRLVSTRRDLVVASYALLQRIGRMDVINLGVTNTAYDPSVHRDEVRHKWIGTRITDDEWNTEIQAEPVK